MSSVERFERRDWLISSVIFGVALALRIPLRNQFAFYWDSAQFALAVEHYDLASSLPHPPGYFLYVMFGRLVNLIVHEPHTTLLWMSLVFGSALPATFYLLGAATFSRAAGLVTAVIGLTSPLTWFYSLIVYTYVVDACCVTLFALLCWRARQHGVTWCHLIALSLLYAVILGTRQQSGLTLSPLFLYTLWGAQQQRFRKIVVAAVLSGVCVLLWFVPLAATAGGVQSYLHIAGVHFEANRGRTPNSVLMNLNAMSRFSIAALLLAAPILAFAYLLRRKQLAAVLTRRQPDARVWFYMAWLGPMTVFWSLTYTHLPGHVMSYFCGLAILAGGATVVVGKRPWSIAVLTVFVGASSIYAFMARPAMLQRFLLGWSLSNRDIRENDQRVMLALQSVRKQFNPHETLLVHGNEYFVFGFRQFQYHLPEFKNILLTPDSSLPGENGRRLWLGQNRQTSFEPAIPANGIRTILLVVPSGESPSIFSRWVDLQAATPVESSEKLLWQVPIAALRR